MARLNLKKSVFSLSILGHNADANFCAFSPYESCSRTTWWRKKSSEYFSCSRATGELCERERKCERETFPLSLNDGR